MDQQQQQQQQRRAVGCVRTSIAGQVASHTVLDRQRKAIVRFGKADSLDLVGVY